MSSDEHEIADDSSDAGSVIVGKVHTNFSLVHILPGRYCQIQHVPVIYRRIAVTNTRIGKSNVQLDLGSCSEEQLVVAPYACAV